MANVFLDAQLHYLARLLVERNSGNLDGEIRDLHDAYMLVPDQQFEAFKHDLKCLTSFESERLLNVSLLRPLGWATVKLDDAMGSLANQDPQADIV